MRALRVLVISLVLLSFVSTVIAQQPPPVAREFTLTELVTLALEHSPSLAMVEADVGARQGQLIGAKAYPNPELSVGAGPGRSLDGPPKRGTEEAVRLLQPFEWVPKRSARVRAAEQGVEASALARKDTVLRVTAEVTSAFYALLGTQRELTLTLQTLSVVEQLATTARKRVEAGEAAKFERVKAEVELQRITKEVERAHSRVTQAKAALAASVGRDVGAAFEATGEFPEAPKDYSLEELLAVAIQQHPRIQAYERGRMRRAALLEAAQASRMPDVSVFGSFEREIDRESYRAGLLIPLPLWSQRQGEIAEARAAVHRADAEAQQVRVELIRDLTQAYEQYRIAKGQLDLFRKGLLRQAQEALEIARKSYQFGEVSLLELLDAQRVSAQTSREFYQAQVDLAVASAQVERLTGGLP